MSKFEQMLKQSEKPVHEGHSAGEQGSNQPLGKNDNKILLDSRPKDVPQGFATPTITDSSHLHPQGAFSPEGPPAKLFDGLGANGQRVENGVIYSTESKDGSQIRTIRDPAANTTLQDIARPDGTNELVKSFPNSRETDKYDSDGKLRSYELIDNNKNRPDKNTDVVINREYDHGEKIADNNRWKDSTGTWHENNFMKMSDGSTYSVVMNGNTINKRLVKPDGSWTNQLQTRDVDKVNPATGSHYKGMDVVNTSSDDPPQK